MRKLAEDMGFRDCPVPVFEKIDLKDEIQFDKVITRLVEVGVITGEQAIETLESGLYPAADDMVGKQEEYKALRDKGLFKPLLGGSQESGDGRPKGAKAPQTTKKVGVIGTGKGSSDSIEETYSLKGIQKVYGEAIKLGERAEAMLKEKHKVKKLNKNQKDICFSIVKNVVAANTFEQWDAALAAFIKDENIVSDKDFANSVAELSHKMELDQYNAAIMLHSKTAI
jgi:hypothetical protein